MYGTGKDAFADDAATLLSVGAASGIGLVALSALARKTFLHRVQTISLPRYETSLLPDEKYVCLSVYALNSNHSFVIF